MRDTTVDGPTVGFGPGSPGCCTPGGPSSAPVRGWFVALVGATVAVGLLTGRLGRSCTVPIGDSLSLVHARLNGDGSITVRVVSLTGLLRAPAEGAPGVARAGVLATRAGAALGVKDGAGCGSACAAVVVVIFGQRILRGVHVHLAPLSLRAGFAVLCAWVGLALAAASHLFRRRDA
jgi:hypothetical protein